MENRIEIAEYFSDLELTKEYNGYFYSVAEVVTIVILGSFCGLKNVCQVQQWAANPRISEFLREEYGIVDIPCYYWMLCLMKLVKPASFNKCFINWVLSLLPEKRNFTLPFDGKTICSTDKMEKYKNPMHIVSAQIAELGITFGQQTVDGKSNEIPAVRELLQLLDIRGCIVVADALNCQKETAKTIILGGADYLLSVKYNHLNLKKDIEDYVQDDFLRESMDMATKTEKNRDRIEKRTAFVTNDINWLESKGEWANLACIGAINTQFTTKNGTSDEWHYYISSRNLTADELLYHARQEWTVETMHWLLDVHFGKDFCRVRDENILQNLNIIRKFVINKVKMWKEKTKSKRPISKILLDCLLDPNNILPFFRN